jgi:hypothetical protein
MCTHVYTCVPMHIHICTHAHTHGHIHRKETTLSRIVDEWETSTRYGIHIVRSALAFTGSSGLLSRISCV